MGNFEKLSVLVIVVIIVMILVVALYTWTGDPSGGETAAAVVPGNNEIAHAEPAVRFPPTPDKPSAKDPSKPTPGWSAQQVIDEINRAKAAKANGEPAMGEIGLVDQPPVVVEPPPAPKEPRVHVVAQGETIGKIAKIEYPGAGQKAIDGILKANPTVDPSRLAIGYKLVLPELLTTEAKKAIDPASKATTETPVATIKPGSIYVTKKGDTLPGLAKRAYRDSNQWHRIWVENFDEIQDTEHLSPGMRLRIPVL